MGLEDAMALVSQNPTWHVMALLPYTSSRFSQGLLPNHHGFCCWWSQLHFNWLEGTTIAGLAPCVFFSIPKEERIDVLWERSWQITGQDISGGLTVAVLSKFLDIWDLLTEVQLHLDIQDEQLGTIGGSRRMDSIPLSRYVRTSLMVVYNLRHATYLEILGT